MKQKCQEYNNGMSSQNNTLMDASFVGLPVGDLVGQMEHEQVAASWSLHTITGDDRRAWSEARRVRSRERRREIAEIFREDVLSLLDVQVLDLVAAAGVAAVIVGIVIAAVIVAVIVRVVAGSGVRAGVVEAVSELLLVASCVQPSVVLHLSSRSDRHHRHRNHRGHHVGHLRHLRHLWIHVRDTFQLVVVVIFSIASSAIELTIIFVEIHLTAVANGIEQ